METDKLLEMKSCILCIEEESPRELVTFMSNGIKSFTTIPHQKIFLFVRLCWLI